MRHPKGLIPIVVVIFITIIAGGIVATSWYYNEHKDEVATTNNNTNTVANKNTNTTLNTNTTSNTNTTTYTNTTTTNTASDETADWQTYTGNGISIMYPPEWGVNPNIDIIGYQYDMIGFGAPGYSGDVNWGISRYSTSEKTIEEVIADIGDQFSDRQESRETITVDGVSAQKVTVTTNQYDDWVAIQIVFEKDGIIYDISNGAYIDEKFDAFYKSFKFIN